MGARAVHRLARRHDAPRRSVRRVVVLGPLAAHVAEAAQALERLLVRLGPAGGSRQQLAEESRAFHDAGKLLQPGLYRREARRDGMPLTRVAAQVEAAA